MYRLYKYVFPNSIEYEYKYMGNYGARGEKRAKKSKATPEQIKKQNQRNREKKMRRLIKANFRPGDIWGTLKYPKGSRKGIDEVKEDLRTFLSDMRRAYKKREEPFKFIYRMEIGERGGIHIHILLNRLESDPADLLIERCWKKGRVFYTPIYEAGGYEELAEYIVKQPNEEVEKQLSLFPEEERKEFVKYSSSRNLIRPEPEVKEYRRWTLKKLIENGPKPTPGFYIDKNSILQGVNQYTGMSYYQYTEIRVAEIHRGSLPRQGDNYENGKHIHENKYKGHKADKRKNLLRS